MIAKLIKRFCSEGTKKGMDYSNWVLARAAAHNHNIAHMKRKQLKDRFSIHQLTNIEFMCHVVNRHFQFNLRINEKIVLLAHMNHIIEVMNKKRENFHEVGMLAAMILQGMADPDDLPCLGTYLCSLTWMHVFSDETWTVIMDNLLANKYDEEYDELFGVYVALQQYRQWLSLQMDYRNISKDNVVPRIPIIYRNSLETLRKYITYNLYNLKECRLLFEALYHANINEGYFWTSMRDWFNIFIKEQLNQREMDSFFLMNENSVDKVLHDQGMIRPRPILQELTHTAFVLSEFGFTSWRFVEFAQDIILYSMDNGSRLYDEYLQLAATQPSESISLNKRLEEELQFYSEDEKQSVKEMEKSYKVIFVNPIDLQNQSLVYFLIVLARAYKNPKSVSSEKDYDRKEEVYLDPRVTKWLLLRLVKLEMKYTIREILQIIGCAEFLEKHSQLQIKGFVLEKLKCLRSLECSYAELEKMMFYVPLEQFSIFVPILKYFLVRNHPSEVYRMVQLMDKNLWIPRLVEVLMALPKIVNSHYRYYSFEENCYYLYLLLKTRVFWEEYHGSKIEFESEMEKLKESIKLVTYTRGFKLTPDTYFHKIMEYIDVVEFFEGGTL